MEIGYTMMCEQSGPKQLVSDLRQAEDAGFDFSVVSDHIFPWLDSQGHSPYAWSVLGAAAQATERIPLMTVVTCPIKRYHPVVIAQKAATVQFRWFSAGWKVNAELPGTATFAAASASVRPEDVAEQIPCGRDIRRVLDGIRTFSVAGFTHLALVQVGGDHQAPFIEWAASELLEQARSI